MIRCPYQKRYSANYNANTLPDRDNRCKIKIHYKEFYSKKDPKYHAPIKGHLSECENQPFQCKGCKAIVCYRLLQQHREECTTEKQKTHTPGEFEPLMKRPKLKEEKESNLYSRQRSYPN